MNKFLVIVVIGMLTVNLFANDEKALEIDSEGVVKVNKKLVDNNGVTYDALPVGTILMYNGEEWDTKTLPGWYICDGNNGTPDLLGRFVMGSTTTTNPKGEDKRKGGSNMLELEQKHLPAHEHDIDISTSTNEDGQHRHALKDFLKTANIQGNSSSGTTFTRFSFSYENTPELSRNQIGYDFAEFYHTIMDSQNEHSHKIDYSGKSGSTGSNEEFDNRPSYYSVIYIMKVE